MDGLLLRAFALLLASATAGAQGLLFIDPDADVARVFGPDGGAWIEVSGAGELLRGATDGTGAAWLADAATPRLHRADPATGTVLEIPLPGFPRGLATGSSGTVRVVTRDAAGGSASLLEIEADGAVATIASLPDGADLLARRPDGGAWLVLDPGLAPATLLRLDGAGSPLGLWPLGILPLALRVAPDGGAWVLTALPPELRRYGPQGGLVAVRPVPADVRDFVVGADGALALARAGSGVIELREPGGAFSIAHGVGGQPQCLALDGRGRPVFVDALGGTLRRLDDGLTGTTSVLAVLPGSAAPGVGQALDHVLGAGGEDDPDGDEVGSREEVAWRVDPFDAADAPFGIEADPPLAAGATGQLVFRAAGRPWRMILTGLSDARTGRGAGAAGFSLAPGPLFDWYQAGAAGLWPFVWGLLDGSGTLLAPIALPDDPALVGLVLHWSFVVLDDPFDFSSATASPAFATVVS
ncbi:MAG: hypothetical protein R3F20_04740 [Planctomycetota bacterium]